MFLCIGQIVWTTDEPEIHLGELNLVLKGAFQQSRWLRTPMQWAARSPAEIIVKKSDEKQISDRGRMLASRGRCDFRIGNANGAIFYVEFA